MAFHVPFGILVVMGILGNMVALAWNCWRKETRRQLLTVLVSSLAVADFFFSLQFLLQEVIVLQALKAGRETLVTFSETDKGIFLSLTFFGYASCNAIMVTTVAISVHSYLSLRGGHRNAFTIAFVLIGWMTSIGVAIAATMNLRDYFSVLPSAVHIDLFANVIMVGHIAASIQVNNATLYPMIVTCFNAIASVVCTVFYISVWRMIRKKLPGRNESTRQDIRQIHIRLSIIVAMNMLCWWPACAVFLYVYSTKNSVWNRGIPEEITIPIFFVTAAACVANPIIYTITSKPFIKTMTRACCFKRTKAQQNTARCCNLLCCSLEMAHAENMSDMTEETEAWNSFH